VSQILRAEGSQCESGGPGLPHPGWCLSYPWTRSIRKLLVAATDAAELPKWVGLGC
jgi:hypothetical protein